jgi:hypothetical protein
MIGERDIGQESTGLVLQGSQLGKVRDPVLGRLHVPVQHGAVGGDPQLVRDAVHPKPLLARQLALRDRRAHGGAEDFRAPARQAGETRLLECQQHLPLRGLLDARQVGDLHRRERLDVHLRVPLLEAADHVRVIGQPELRVQTTDDVELPGGHPARLLGLVEHLLQRASVGAVLLRHPRKGAEHARVPENADIGRIDVLIGGEEHPVAVPPPVGEIRQGAKAEQIGGLVKSDPVGAGEALARAHLVGDGNQTGIAQARCSDGTGHPISLRLRR